MDIIQFIVYKYITYAPKLFRKRRRMEKSLNKMHIYYRICEQGYVKVKPDFITKENCLRNAVEHFPPNLVEWHLYADNVSEKMYEMILKYVPSECIRRVSIGNGSDTFRLVYEDALKNAPNDLIYFLEDDYIHRGNAYQSLKEVATANLADYITLYDCPDKYGYNTANVFVRGGENCKVFLCDGLHWKTTNSTTMTFAAFVDTLKEDRYSFFRWTKTTHPYDFNIFIELGIIKRRKLICPIPSVSTHGETALLAPCITWEENYRNE